MFGRFFSTLKLAVCAAFVAQISLSGCISSNNETVIERSAATRPAWTNGDYTDEGSSVVFMNFVRKEVYRLELGLKQAQLAAVNDTKNLLLSRAKQQLVGKSESFYKASRSDVESGIERGVISVRESSKYKPDDGTPRTVYWEQMSVPTSDGTKTYYNIYVLLTAPRELLEDAMLRILTEMQKQSGAPKEFANAVINESRQ